MTVKKSIFDKVVFTKIILYFILAFGISYFLNSLPNPLYSYGIKMNINYGFGPFLSALIVSYMYKSPLKMRLFSKTTWIRRTELIGLAIFSIGTITNSIIAGSTNYLLIILSLFLSLLYTLLEELGWRVFLVNELNKYSFLTVFLISTTLWFIWHYSFLEKNIMAHPLQFLILIAAGSAGMIQFYRQTKSWMIVALTHAVVSVNLPTIVIFLVVTVGLLRFHKSDDSKVAI
jgi:hypothetical protein